MSDLNPLALIVEDEPAIAQLLATILTMQGYQTTKMFRGDEVMASVACARPDLITLDLNMPGTDGATLLRQLRANPDTADLPVILVSACTQIAPELAAEVQNVITKPFELGELIAAVQEVSAAQQQALQLGA